jgi:hypothetical protein
MILSCRLSINLPLLMGSYYSCLAIPALAQKISIVGGCAGLLPAHTPNDSYLSAESGRAKIVVGLAAKPPTKF